MRRTVIGYQRWEDLLFLHWALDDEAEARLQRLLPEGLELDRYDGKAYVTMTPFSVTHARLRYTPEVPGFAAFHEINVRTYVRHDGEPGVWFLSLDAASAPAAAVARASVRLPYFPARIRRDHGAVWDRYDVVRRGSHSAVRFRAEWSLGGAGDVARAGSLQSFLVERYVLFSRALGPKLWRIAVRHRPWVLHPLAQVAVSETLHAAAGLPPLGFMVPPRWSPGVDVTFYAPQIV